MTFMQYPIFILEYIRVQKRVGFDKNTIPTTAMTWNSMVEDTIQRRSSIIHATRKVWVCYTTYGCGLVEWGYVYDERSGSSGGGREGQAGEFTWGPEPNRFTITSGLLLKECPSEFGLCRLWLVTVIKEMTQKVWGRMVLIYIYKPESHNVELQLMFQRSAAAGRIKLSSWKWCGKGQMIRNERMVIHFSVCYDSERTKVFVGHCDACIHYFLERNRNVCNLKDTPGAFVLWKG